MAAVYDHYYSVKAYERRYPQPNASTLRFLLRHGAGQARQILDFGCGNGRYAMALLERSDAELTGYDISGAALREFAARLGQGPLAERTRLIQGGLETLERSERYDLVVMLFGVLSHVGDRGARVKVLRRLRALIAPTGRLVLSVPSRWRRRPLELARDSLRRAVGLGQADLAEPGSIVFSRRVAGVAQDFFYHLYSVRSLRAELEEAGWRAIAVEAESVLPEWLVTQHPTLGRLDAWIARALPAGLGYGIRVACAP